jgi:hypothetical protein
VQLRCSLSLASLRTVLTQSFIQAETAMLWMFFLEDTVYSSSGRTFSSNNKVIANDSNNPN